MIESVTVTNYLGESREMVLANPEPSGFIVKSIDGLGPASANINFSELVTIDGAIQNSARLDTREVKIDLIFLENPTIEDTRHQTYQFFPVKRPVRLTVKTRAFNNTCILHCDGTVEKNEPKIFSQQEGCSITIKCGDPYFHSETFTKKMFYGVDPMFEFPFSNESVEEEYIPGKQDIEFSKKYIHEGLYKEYQYDAYGGRAIGIKVGKVNGTSLLLERKFSAIPGTPNYLPPSSTTMTLYEDNDYVIEIAHDDGFFKVYSGVFDPNNINTYYSIITIYGRSAGGTALVGDDIEFGDISLLREGNVVYAGDAETGMILTIHAYGEAQNVSFMDFDSRERMALSDEILIAKTGQGIIAGDEIVINMTRGNKSAYLIRGGQKYDILNALIKPIKWFHLSKGNNVFGYETNPLSDLGNLVFTVTYDELYEGI